MCTKIREQAEEHLFNSMLSPNPAQPYGNDSLTTSISNGAKYISIIEALAYTIPEAGAPQIGQQLAEKMSNLVQWLQSQPPPTTYRQPSDGENDHNQPLAYIYFWYVPL